MSLFVDIEKKLGNFSLGVKLEAGEETLALLGASGCGKSLTLKCIAGIEKPDRGKIVVDGVTLFDSEKRINLSPQKRRTGLMFQNYALFPNMTVLENILAGARGEKKQGRERARSILERFGLQDHAGHYPHQLSGGQQQRVALGRILISEPKILLLDEPFSALDGHLRLQLEQELRQVLRSFGKTAVLVSHEKDELFRMSDSIAVMDRGSIQTLGRKEAVFAAPQTLQAARLTGCQNISGIQRLPRGRVRALDWGLELNLPHLPETATAIGIRAHEIKQGQGGISCRVIECVEGPFSQSLLLRPLGSGEKVGLWWEREKNRRQEERVSILLPEEAILPLEDRI